MKVLDYLATAAAVGVFGYFVWKVIVPKLGDLQLPSWQPPQFPQPQPQQPIAIETPQLPSTPPTSPTPSTPAPSPQQPSAPAADEDEEDNEADKEESTGPSAPPAVIGPAPAAVGGLLYDSNTHGKWNNGQKRTVTGAEGGQGPDGKGFHTAASGNPTFTIDGNGVGHLSGNGGHPRIYIYAKNYNARLEGEFMFETITSQEDDISLKIRSRHGHSGHTTGGGKQCASGGCGGIGVSYGADGSIKLKAEPCHGSNPSMGGGTAAKPVIGKWYKFALSVWDAADGSIQSKFDLDGRTVGTGKLASAPAHCKTKSFFDADSYFWLRINPAGQGRAAFRNIKLYDLGSSGGITQRQLLINAPYLFNSFYNRRRL